MLVVLVHVHVKPESLEAFKAATLENTAASRREPGIAQFEVIQHEDDPNKFVLIEAYRDKEATLKHKETAHYLKWRDAVAPMMVEPRTSTKCMALDAADGARTFLSA